MERETYLYLERGRGTDTECTDLGSGIEGDFYFFYILIFCIFKVFYSKHGLFAFNQKTKYKIPWHRIRSPSICAHRIVF